MVSASVCHTEDASSILVTCSNALMAEGIMHRTLNPAIKVRVLVGVLNIGNIARRSSSWLLTNRRGFDSLYSRNSELVDIMTVDNKKRNVYLSIIESWCKKASSTYG